MPFGTYKTHSASVAALGGFDFVQLLPTGSVMACVESQTWILDPDVAGGYNHSNWRRTTDILYSAKYGTVSVLNDGRIIVHPGEFGYAAYYGQSQIFDPVNETWSAINRQISWHSSTNITDDGKILATQSGTNGTLTPENGDIYNSVNYTSLAWSASESQLIALPDGRFVNFVGGGVVGSGTVLQTIATTNTSENVAAGSFNGTNSVVSTDFTQTLLNFRDNHSNVGQWTSFGAVGYEIGPGGWMPKMGQVVLVGGQGWIFAYDPATSTLTKRGILGIDAVSSQPTSVSMKLGTVTSANNGKSATQIETASTFEWSTVGAQLGTINQATALNNATVKKVYIKILASTANPSFIALDYTQASANATTQILTLTGVTRQTTQGNVSSATATGDEVCWGRPSYIVQDGPGTFLPNGDLMVGGQVEQTASNNNFGGTLVWLKWNSDSGMAAPIVNDISANPGCPTYPCQIFNLPDGTVFVKQPNSSGNGHVIYTPTTAEATPFSGSQPVITDFPLAVERKQTCRLFGTQLNGLHEGGMYGDDGSPRSNFPIVRFKNAANGNVYTCRTYNYTYRGIGVGRASQATVQIPATVPDGLYQMTVVAGGVTSATRDVIVRSGTGDSIFINSYR